MKRRVMLHLFWSPIEFESRLYRETAASLQMQLFDEVHVGAIGSQMHAQNEAHASGLHIHRQQVPMLSRTAQQASIGRLIKLWRALQSLLLYWISVIRLARHIRATHFCCHNAFLLPITAVCALLFRGKFHYSPHELESRRKGLSGVSRKITEFIEWIFVRFAENIVVVCEPIAIHYRNKFSKSLVYVIRSIPLANFDFTTNRVTEHLEKWTNSDPIQFVYQGVLAPWRGIDGILAQIVQIKVNFFQFKFIGKGESVQNILAHATARADVLYVPSLPIDQLLTETAKSHVGVIIFEDPLPESYVYCLPNKFFEYIQSGLPVVVSSNLVYLAELVATHNLGWIVDCDKFSQFASTLSKSEAGEKLTAVHRYAARETWEREMQIYHLVYVQ